MKAPLKPLTHAQLETRRAMGLQNINLEQLMRESFEEVGVQPPTPPRFSPRYRFLEGKSMTWETKGFGEITVEMQKHSLGIQTGFDGINSWAQIDFNGQPKLINVSIMHKLAPGVSILFCQDGKILDDVTDSKNTLIFGVPVFWHGNVPHSGSSKKRDVSVVLVSPDATFMQLEIAITTRDGAFWLSFQEMCTGQIARTTKAKADRLQVATVNVDGHTALVAPLYSECNYPGADFLKINGMVHGVVEYCVKRGFSKPLSQCSIAGWAPIEKDLPEDMVQSGWTKATVNFFNFAWGQGFAVCDDGAPCHIHFSKITDATGVPVQNKGEFPVINPMSQVAIKFVEGPKGRSAIAVCPL